MAEGPLPQGQYGHMPNFHYPPANSAAHSSVRNGSPQPLPLHFNDDDADSDFSQDLDALAITVSNSPPQLYSPRSPRSPAQSFTPRIHHSPPPSSLVVPDASPLTPDELSDLFHSLSSNSGESVSRSDLTSALLVEAAALHLEGDHKATVDTLVHHRWTLPSPSPSLPSDIPRDTFDALAATWDIPSQTSATEVLDAKSRVYESELPIGRRLLAHWSVEGPMSTFVIFFVWLQTALGIYYFVHWEQSPYREVLGWGLPFAKMASGVLYPSLAFVLLSSCRRLATFLRRWTFMSKFINWDRSQYFHAFLGMTILVFSLIHGLSHLIGDFREAVGNTSPLLSNFPHPNGEITYASMISTRAGITGILALFLLLIISATGQERVRRSRFQLFQYSHLLIWPFIILLLIHGTGKLLASPILGYWLIVPMLCALWDRVPRIVNMYRPIKGVTFEMIEDSTVVIKIPQSSVTWQYRPGQYVLLRVQEVAYGQWHPFTVVGSIKPSTEEGVAGVIYMRKAGDWTGNVMARAEKGLPMTATIDGPFGSPSDQLSNYQRIVIVGTGIGVTPYAGWLHDISPQQTVDFHWVVRDQISFTWFSALLNQFHLGPGKLPTAAVNVRTYATGLAPRTTLQYVMRLLLEKHRTISHSTSFITGLECETRYGRPDIAKIFEVGAEGDRGKDGRIGVFFCGPNYLGMEISDRCRMERLKTGVKWEFVGEVF